MGSLPRKHCVACPLASSARDSVDGGQPSLFCAGRMQEVIFFDSFLTMSRSVQVPSRRIGTPTRCLFRRLRVARFWKCVLPHGIFWPFPVESWGFGLEHRGKLRSFPDSTSAAIVGRITWGRRPPKKDLELGSKPFAGRAIPIRTGAG